MSFFRRAIERQWYQDRPSWLLGLRPLEALYRIVVARRRQGYQQQPERVQHPGVPVIVVGNLTVGGSGKSPVVAALAQFFQQQGWRPGIVSRGYGGQAPHYPCLVSADTTAAQVGDEPQMLFEQLALPVAVAPDRAAAARLLVEQGCDLLLADDGLQHWALGRDLELVVIDGQRGFGNQYCLPVGPLREPLTRLAQVDALLVQGAPSEDLGRLLEPVPVTAWSYGLKTLGWRRGDGHWQSSCPFAAGQAVQALAGIGHPQRFFDQLQALGLHVSGYPLADHAVMDAHTLGRLSTSPLPWVMTAKDAVKLRPWLNEQHWVQEVCADLPEDFLHQLHLQVQHIKEEKYHG